MASPINVDDDDDDDHDDDDHESGKQRLVGGFSCCGSTPLSIGGILQ